MNLEPSWVWMGLAALFIIGEIFTAGFFLLWFGVGAAVAGVLALLGVDILWQIAAFVVVSFALFLGTRRFANRFTRHQPPGVGADRYQGRQGLVTETIHNVKGTGRVRLDGDEWRAKSANGNFIMAGSTVMVLKVDGTALVVSPVKEEHI